MDETITLYALAAAAAVAVLPKLRRRLQLSRAKHPSLAGHSRMAKRVAGMLPGYSYGAEAEAKAAMEERKALAREVQFLKDRTKLLAEQVDKERSAARDRELRLKGKYDAMLERSANEAEGQQVAALTAQVADLQAALEGSFEREAELKALLGRG
jgi:hypothetical protein